MANEGSTKPTYSELEQELADERLAFNHANEVVGKLESDLARVRGLLQQDAAGRPVSELLQLAANYMNENGGGPLADCLQLKAQEIEATLADSREPEKLNNAHYDAITCTNDRSVALAESSLSSPLHEKRYICGHSDKEHEAAPLLECGNCTEVAASPELLPTQLPKAEYPK